MRPESEIFLRFTRVPLTIFFFKNSETRENLEPGTPPVGDLPTLVTPLLVGKGPLPRGNSNGGRRLEDEPNIPNVFQRII